jgi:FRG domain
MAIVVNTPITSVSSFFKFLESQPPQTSKVELYRGHPNRLYELKPSLFRVDKHRKDEKNILREILSQQPSEFETDKGTFEQLVRMQHYGLKTRLLDLSFNPLVALYFACAGTDEEKEADGHFIRLSVDDRSVKYFDSDTVSCVANLSKLTGKERDTLRHIKDKSELNTSDAGLRHLQFIRSEKPYFLPEMQPQHLKDALVVKPRQTNKRLLAQQGAFLLFGLTASFEEDDYSNIKVYRKRIPAGSKPNILEQLDKININESSLFPEIERAASYILSKLTPLPPG